MRSSDSTNFDTSISYGFASLGPSVKVPVNGVSNKVELSDIVVLVADIGDAVLIESSAVDDDNTCPGPHNSILQQLSCTSSAL